VSQALPKRCWVYSNVSRHVRHLDLDAMVTNGEFRYPIARLMCAYVYYVCAGLSGDDEYVGAESQI
jgi:hypothetical protein